MERDGEQQGWPLHLRFARADSCQGMKTRDWPALEAAGDHGPKHSTGLRGGLHCDATAGVQDQRRHHGGHFSETKTSKGKVHMMLCGDQPISPPVLPEEVIGLLIEKLLRNMSNPIVLQLREGKKWPQKAYSLLTD